MSAAATQSSDSKIRGYLAAQEAKGLLRVITCGSVDDGKSTLIGRLLYDSKLLFEDQIAALRNDSARFGTTGSGELDLALLVDGLADEREQGITIDVAYRFFSTDKKKFIVADTPGHEQYTRNMVTGASTADAAILLVDARKGVITQTRRHCFIASLLGIRHVALAINKMDLVGWDRDVYAAIADSFRALARQLGIPSVSCIPLSALRGDNVMHRSANMPWYDGQTLLADLEALEQDAAQRSAPFRMPVQYVIRPDQDFRGYAGTIVAGSLAPGDEVCVLPSGRKSRIARIASANGDLNHAAVEQAVTVTLEDDIDVSRGDILVDAGQRPEISDQFSACIVWMASERLIPGRPYLMRIGSAQVGAQITDIKYVVNVNTLEHLAARHLDLNEIAICNLAIDRPIPFEPYEKNRDMGGFILIDRMTNATAGCGMIRFGLRRADNLHWQALHVGKSERAAIKQQRPCILWLTGLSGSGKSTIADMLEQRLVQLGRHTVILDGDNIRHGLCKDLGFTDDDRVENIRRVAEVARLMVEAGLIVIVSFISPFRSERQLARSLVEAGEFIEIYVDTPISVCEARDPKGLYRKARAGKIPNFTGISSPYEPPETPELHLRTEQATPADSTEQILDLLQQLNYI